MRAARAGRARDGGWRLGPARRRPAAGPRRGARSGAGRWPPAAGGSRGPRAARRSRLRPSSRSGHLQLMTGAMMPAHADHSHRPGRRRRRRVRPPRLAPGVRDGPGRAAHPGDLRGRRLHPRRGRAPRRPRLRGRRARRLLAHPAQLGVRPHAGGRRGLARDDAEVRLPAGGGRLRRRAPRPRGAAGGPGRRRRRRLLPRRHARLPDRGGRRSGLLRQLLRLGDRRDAGPARQHRVPGAVPLRRRRRLHPGRPDQRHRGGDRGARLFSLNTEPAGHAFDNHEAPMFWNEAAAVSAWRETTAFLDRHLPVG